MSIYRINYFMTLVDVPLQAMLPVRKTTETKNTLHTKNISLYSNQHCSVGGRGGTIILSYGWSHNFCEFGSIFTFKAKITRKLFEE